MDCKHWLEQVRGKELYFRIISAMLDTKLLYIKSLVIK